MSRLIDSANALPLLGPMLVIALGYALGRMSIRGISAGPAGGTLVVALVLGSAGLASSASAGAPGVTLGTLGFALFIYSVGFDAAPHFRSTLRQQRGWAAVTASITVNLLALAAAVTAAHLLDLDAATAAGVLSGALTSAPTYAAALEQLGNDPRLAVAFAITYPFGLVGIVLAIQVLPRLLGEDLVADAIDREESLGRKVRAARPRAASSAAVARTFSVENEEVTGRPLSEVQIAQRTGCLITQVRHDSEVVIADGDTVLALSDRVLAVGDIEELRSFEALVGPESVDPLLEQQRLPGRRIEVRNPNVAGKALSELDIIRRHHCVLTRVERGSLCLEPDAPLELGVGDIVEAVGRRNELRRLAQRLGRFEPSLRQTDIAVYATGIVLGVLVGSIHLRAFGVDISPGMAGGLLLAGLVLGGQQHFGRLQTHVPQEARQLVRDLGILLFVAETGMQAGPGLVATLSTGPWRTLTAGILVNMFAIVGAYLIARSMLRLSPIDRWGSIAGGLTSSAALHAARQASDSDAVAVPYAAAYAVGSVLATVAGPLAVMLVG